MRVHLRRSTSAKHPSRCGSALPQGPSLIDGVGKDLLTTFSRSILITIDLRVSKKSRSDR